ncbi:MAG: SRPBCC family protein [Dehalococcoidia bacterium]
MPPLNHAPVRSVSNIDIAAPAAEVWRVLAGLSAWPEWNKDVRAIDVRGPVAPGTTFRWKAGPGWITSRLIEVDAPGRIVWTGSTLGIRALHVHDIAQQDGVAHVRSEESWSGLLPWILRRPMRSMLSRSLDSGLAQLKRRVEQGHEHLAGASSHH